jgi:hypothetical protein
MNYKSCITNFTREIINQQPSCIDHIWTNSKHTENLIGIIWKTEITDHYTSIYAQKNNQPTKVTPRICNRKIIDYDALERQLKDETWAALYCLDEPNMAAAHFEHTLECHIMRATRTKTILIKNNATILKPWITNGLLVSVRRKNQIYKRTKKFPNDKRLLTHYRKYRNYLTSLIRKTKNDFYSRKIADAGNNCKKVWDTINSALSKPAKSGKVREIEHDNRIVCADQNPREVANIFNTFFANVGKDLASKIVPQNNIPTNNPCLNPALTTLSEISPNSIENIIMSLKSDSSPGYDKVNARILKHLRTYISKPLAFVVNLCIGRGIFPNNYKTSIITPIFKSGDSKQVNNYRPISIISNVAKIFEKVIKSQIMSYILDNGIISKNQFGFMPGLGTQDAIARLTSEIYTSLDQGKKCIGTFVDLKKAFDSISHSKLINKLAYIGISGRALSLFESYLKNRRQFTRMGETLSDSAVSEFGIPQGTVLGPTLFILYVNDLFSLNLTSTVLSYADDTVLLTKGSSWDEVTQTINRDLNILKNWFNTNLLSLNADKTVCVPFSINKRGLPDTLNIVLHRQPCVDCNDCYKLKTINCTKYLGIHIDSNVKWKTQIQKMKDRLRKLYYVFVELRNFLNPPKLKIAYYALAQSILTYGILAWGAAYEVTLSPLLVTQRTLLKIIHRRPRDYSTSLLFAEAKVLSIHQLFRKIALLQTFKEKATNGYNESSSRLLRSLNLIPIPLCNRDMMQHHYFYLGIKNFNDLPNEIRAITESTMFKNKITELIIGEDIG